MSHSLFARIAAWFGPKEPPLQDSQLAIQLHKTAAQLKLMRKVLKHLSPASVHNRGPLSAFFATLHCTLNEMNHLDAQVRRLGHQGGDDCYVNALLVPWKPDTAINWMNRNYVTPFENKTIELTVGLSHSAGRIPPHHTYRLSLMLDGESLYHSYATAEEAPWRVTFHRVDTELMLIPIGELLIRYLTDVVNALDIDFAALAAQARLNDLAMQEKSKNVLAAPRS